MSVMVFLLTGLLPVVFILSKVRLNKLRSPLENTNGSRGKKDNL